MPMAALGASGKVRKTLDSTSIIYAFVRLGMLYKTDLGTSFATLAYMLGAAVIGVLIASIILLPVLMTFLNDARLGIAMKPQWLYPLSYYLRLPSIIATQNSEYWLWGGFTTPALLAIPLLFIDKDRNTLLKVFFVMCLMVITFPLAGRLLNGMSYAANRWCWAFALLLSYILATQWTRLTNLTRQTNRALLAFCTLYFIAAAVLLESRNTATFMAVALMLLTVLSLNFRPLNNPTTARNILLIAITLASVFNTASWKFSPDGEAYLLEFIKNNSIAPEWHANEAFLVASQSEDAYPRYTGCSITKNGSLASMVSSTSFFWSLSNPYVADFRTDIETNELLFYDFMGYDDRTSLLALSSVGYYIAKDPDMQGIPYGLSATNMAQDRDYTVYTNDNALPLGYCYEYTIPHVLWDTMNPAQKQQAQLEAALVNKPQPNIATAQVSNQTYETNYRLEPEGTSVFVKDNGLLTTSDNVQVRLTLPNSVENAETYVRIAGFDFAT